MHHFAYRDGALFAEDVDLREIAAEVGHRSTSIPRRRSNGITASMKRR
jgi:hypothetical protein